LDRCRRGFDVRDVNRLDGGRLRSRRFRGRLLGRRFLGRRGNGRERFVQTAHYRRFNRRRRSLDVFTQLSELGDDVLAGYSELFRELVYTGLACHWTP
jgi:hypothetical protein